MIPTYDILEEGKTIEMVKSPVVARGWRGAWRENTEDFQASKKYSI